MLLGIDFGSKNSMICTKAIDSSLEDIHSVDFFQKQELFIGGIPSIIQVNNEIIKCGFDINPNDYSNLICNLKTLIRNSSDINNCSYANGMMYCHRDLLKNYFTYLINLVKDKKVVDPMRLKEVKEQIEGVVVTTPVGGANNELTKSMAASDYNAYIQEIVCEITKLPKDKVKIIEEPCAAALSFKTKNPHFSGENILVFDLGGMTLDITVLSYDENNNPIFSIKKGNTKLGGEDWDKSFADYLVNKYKLTINSEPLFLKNVEDTKKKLTTKKNIDEHVIIRHKNNHIAKNYNVTRREFDSCTKHLLDQAMELLNEAITEFKNKNNQSIDYIVLVGGSSNMPQIKERIIRQFKFDERCVFVSNPSLAIAEGACVMAGLLFGDKKTSVAGDEYIIPDNVVSHSYGIHAYRTSKGNEQDGISNILRKGSRVKYNEYVEYSSTFYPKDDDQEIVNIIVYENEFEDDFISIDNEKVALKALNLQFPIPKSYLNHAKEYSFEILIKLSYDGIIYCIAKDENGIIKTSETNLISY